MTDAEQKLWANVRNRGLAGAKFRRQVPIGPFVVDFACIESRLVVEIDGGQHGDAVEVDAERTRILNSLGFEVLRFGTATSC